LMTSSNKFGGDQKEEATTGLVFRFAIHVGLHRCNIGVHQHNLLILLFKSLEINNSKKTEKSKNRKIRKCIENRSFRKGFFLPHFCSPWLPCLQNNRIHRLVRWKNLHFPEARFSWRWA
jgi:hypothetical protein